MKFQNSGIIQYSNNGGINVNGNYNHIPQYQNTSGSSKQEVTLREWELLESFFVERQLNYSSQSEQFHACTDILKEVEKKNVRGAKKILNRVGKETLDTILGMGVKAAVRAAVIPILEKIIGS